MSFLSVLLALLIFGILRFIHELGHFLVARAFGVKILEFSIGMGPKLFSVISKKSGTRYSLRVIPIGGFVSMFGENGMEAVQGSQKIQNPPSNEPFTFVNDIQNENTPENTAKIDLSAGFSAPFEQVKKKLKISSYLIIAILFHLSSILLDCF